jgi:hypothetical protein
MMEILQPSASIYRALWQEKPANYVSDGSPLGAVP